MAFPVNRIITVNEFIQAGGLGFVNFGKTTVMALNAELQGGQTWPVKTFKTFNNITELATYFAETTETYKLASRWFSNRGGQLYVYMRDETNDSVITSANDARGKKWFYNILFTKEVYASESDVLALADWADSNKAYFWMASDDPNVADDSKSDDIASKLLAKGNRHIAVGYRQAATIATDSSQIYFMAGLAAEFAKVNYSGLDTSITGEFKSIIGAVAEDLTPTEITALENKKVVMYTITEEGDQRDVGVVLNSWSMSSYGEFIDDVINVDALSSALRVTCYNVFRKNKKVQLTPKGQAQQIGAADALFKQYFDNGVLGAGNIENPVTTESEFAEFGYKIYTKPEDILQINDADKRKRKMYPINARVNLARAGHSLVIDMTVQ